MSSTTRTEVGGMAPRGWGVWIAIALVAMVIASFWPAFDAQYVTWDDVDNFVKNDRWRGVGLEHLRWMFTTFHFGHYQPLTWLTFGLQYELFGGAPGSYHAFNVFVHAINAVVFFFLTRRLLGISLVREKEELGNRRGGGVEYSKLLTLSAGAAAAFFAVHPLRVESVAWITERRDVLSGMFLLLSATAYLKAVEPGQAKLRSRGWYWGTVVLLLLSCLCKAWGMSFFVVLLALDMYPLRRISGVRGWFSAGGLRVLAEKLPMVLIGLATAAVASMAQKEAFATKTLSEWPLMSRVVQSCYGLLFYVKQSVWPSVHSPLYQLPLEVNPWEGWYLAGYAFVAVLGVAALACARKWPGVTVAIFIYVLLVSPVLGLLQSGEQFVADRYSYLATMPFAVLAAGGTVLLVRRVQSGARGTDDGGAAGLPRLVGLLWGGVLLAFAVASYGQTTVWHDSRTLWRYAVDVTPSSAVLRYYGAQLHEDPAQAAELYKRAVEINPKDGVTWYSYGNLVRDMGDKREAERAYLEAAKYMPQAYAAHQNLGVLYWEQGRRAEAERQFELGIGDVERPGQPRPSGGPYITMAIAKKEAGKKDEAVAALRKALKHEDVRESAETMLREMGERP